MDVYGLIPLQIPRCKLVPREHDCRLAKFHRTNARVQKRQHQRFYYVLDECAIVVETHEGRLKYEQHLRCDYRQWRRTNDKLCHVLVVPADVQEQAEWDESGHRGGKSNSLAFLYLVR